MDFHPTLGPPPIFLATSPLPPTTFLTPDFFYNLDEEPITFTVLRFCDEMGRDGMESVREAKITAATCYSRGGISTHDYLLMPLTFERRPLHLDSRSVWMRLERSPSEPTGIWNLSRAVPALDTVTFSSQVNRLKGPNHNMVMDCTFTELRLVHVADLLSIIEDVAPQYVLTSTNCWFYVAVTLESLQIFGQEWKKRLSTDFLRFTVHFFGKPTAGLADKVSQRFVSRWAPDGTITPFESLTLKEARGNSPQRQYDVATGVTHLSRQNSSNSQPQSPISQLHSSHLDDGSLRLPTVTQSSVETIFQYSASAALPEKEQVMLTAHIAVDWSSEPIGKGSYGIIHFATWNGRKIALKELYTLHNKKKIPKRFYRETALWKSKSHPNILPFLEAFTRTDDHEQSMYMASPWQQNGNLKTFLNDINPNADRAALLLGIARGISYLQCKPSVIVHGDLRAVNILISEDGRPLIADFGLATLIEDADNEHPNALALETTTHNPGGNPRWQAPEVITFNGPTEMRKNRLTCESDIYSFAMVVIEVFTGLAPFEEMSVWVVIPRVIDGERPPRPPDPHLSDTLWNITCKCWAHDPSARPSASTLVSLLENM